MSKPVSVLPKLPAAHAKRLAWALKSHGHLLAVAVRQDTSPVARKVEKFPEGQISERVGRIILEQADPTVAKTMTGWLVKQYAEGGLRLEDAGTAHETLDMLHRYAPRLPKGQRDLGQYSSLAKVWEVVSPIAAAEQDKLSGKAQKALDKTKAYAESWILRQDPDGFTIAVPLTEFAAKWWGRGTRWCTAAEKDNQFGHYHKVAPLIIVVIPELKEKGKFQLWATEGDVQFMDAADNSVSDVLITEYWPRFEPVVDFALRKDGWALRYVPEEFRTDEMYRIAVTKNALALWHVPGPLRTEQLCKLAVAKNGLALGQVPLALCTEEMCSIAVAQDGGALSNVPGALRTEELCRIAVAKDGWALRYVPEEFRTDEMYNMALAQDGKALCYVPLTLSTDEMCRIAVAQNGGALKYVPEALRTEEMCSIAVAQKGGALKYAPEALRTDELCRIAVAQNGHVLYYVPERLRSDQMCRIAVAQKGGALEHVPQKLRTEEICRIALTQDGGALEYVPWDLRTKELCRIAVAKDGWALKWVPQDRRTEELCRIAVGSSGLAFDGVPQNLRDRMKALIPLPVPTWDASLLEELVSFLDPASPSAPSGPPSA